VNILGAARGQWDEALQFQTEKTETKGTEKTKKKTSGPEKGKPIGLKKKKRGRRRPSYHRKTTNKSRANRLSEGVKNQSTTTGRRIRFEGTETHEWGGEREENLTRLITGKTFAQP